MDVENKSGRKYLLKFVVALGLAITAGVFNFWYLNSARFSSYYGCAKDLKKGETIKAGDIRLVRFSFPKDVGSSDVESFAATFVSDSEKELLIGAQLNRDHKSGELIARSSVTAANASAPDYRAYGEYRVTSLSDSSLTVRVYVDDKEKKSLDGVSARLAQLASSNSRNGSSDQDDFRICGLLKCPDDPGNLPLLSSRKDEKDGGNFYEYTIELPKGCLIPDSLLKVSDWSEKDYRVALVVRAECLSMDELKNAPKVDPATGERR